MQGQTSDQPVGLDTDQMKIHTNYHFTQSSLTFTPWQTLCCFAVDKGPER